MPLKNALIIAFLLFSAIASATDYYISSSGNDTNNGLSASTPWKTIAKVNASSSTLKPGDRILFNRGDVFYGTITITKSGSAGNPIYIGAYGAGAKPIITGFITVSAWTNLGSNIWESLDAVSTLSTCNIVKINGVNTAMGRYPNTGYLTYQNHLGTTSITSNSLTSTPDWTGAEIVLRKNHYIIDRSNITSHIGSTLIFASGSNYLPTNGFGFFIQNDARTLDIQNEWYYNPSTKKIKVYSLSLPTKVQVATVKTFVYMTSQNYITFDNISFTGSNEDAFDILSSSNVTIQNCSFDFSGINAITAGHSTYLDIVKSSFNHTNNNALSIGEFQDATTNHILVSENTIRNTGTLAGMGKRIDEQTEYSAIFLVGSNNTIEKCVIDSTGYIPIWWRGNSFLVQNNFITNFCSIKDDGGGIYYWNYDVAPFEYTNQKVLNNIILNGIGALEGSVPNKFAGASGIYLDGNSLNIEISRNTVANCNDDGILLHDAHEIVVKNNTLYNNGMQIAIYSDDTPTPTGGVTLIRNTSIKNNIFIAKTNTQYGLSTIITFNDLSSFGIIDSNYYARPIDNNLVFLADASGGGKHFIGYTLAGWQTYSGFDTNSQKSSVSVADTTEINFYYNATNVNKTITLNQPMIDVKGTKYANSIPLLPFASVVLMVDPNPAQLATPIYIGSIIQNTTASQLEMTYDKSLANIVPATSSFTVRVNSVARTVNTVAISGTKIMLTLASAVVYGDIVTVTYTLPSSNPLQTASGGQAVTISAQPVVNNCINAANTPPVVEISNPLKGNKYETNSTITLEAIASDQDGSISKVEFYNGAVKLVELTTAPYIYTWKDVAAGSYSITAVAMDNLNASTTSLPFEFEVGTIIKYDANSDIINLYPNPNDGHFSIEFITQLQNEKSELVITDLAGKQVYNGYVSKEETIKQIDLSYVKSGIYILMILYKGIFVTKKIIIN